MYVCMYVWMYVCMYVCMYVWRDGGMYLFLIKYSKLHLHVLSISIARRLSG